MILVEGLDGLGTLDEPWQLTQGKIDECILRISWTEKTIYFPSGIYFSQDPLIFNFAVLCQVNSAAREVLREGVAVLGEHRSSIIQFGKQEGLHKPSLLFTFTPSHGESQSAIFFYQFRGICIKGDTNNVLVQFGTDVESSPWNSCIFDLSINNGFRGPTDACGLKIFRALRSDLDLDVTCGRGIALVMENAEFSTVRGSFSNAEDHSGGSISVYPGYGLWLISCVSVHFQSINFEVVQNGMKLANHCQGNLFDSIISNNQDEHGVVVEHDNLPENSKNLIVMMTRRSTLQNKSAFPALIRPGSTEKIVFQFDLTS